jgi:hypothetical protein
VSAPKEFAVTRYVTGDYIRTRTYSDADYRIYEFKLNIKFSISPGDLATLYEDKGLCIIKCNDPGIISLYFCKS